ncbi:MAG: PKD domain-containing protein [Flavobacteriales bacterium]|jgi:PKD repeat protein|nr:PKD domain-containing protein [Flavobacteriales bacterium]
MKKAVYILLVICNSALATSLNAQIIDFYWTNATLNNNWTTAGNWSTVNPSIGGLTIIPATHPNNINNHVVHFNDPLAGNCEVNALTEVLRFEIGSAYNGTISINNIFIIRDDLNVLSSTATIIAPSSYYMGIRGDVTLQTGNNFQHNNGEFNFYGGLHNIVVNTGTSNPWELHNVQVTKGAASGQYATFVLNTGDVIINGLTTLGGHPSTGIFFRSGLFKLKGDCIIKNVTNSVTTQDGGLMFVGEGDQFIENIDAPNGYPALFSGLIGRIVIDKPNPSSTMLINGAISVKREFKIASTNNSIVDATSATLILAMVSASAYPDPSFDCRVSLATPLIIDNLVINPRQNSGFEVLGSLTVKSTLETRNDRRMKFKSGVVNLEGDLEHNNYFGYSTTGDPVGAGVFRFSGSVKQAMHRTPTNLREFKGMLPNLEIDNPSGVDINGLYIVDKEINFVEGHFTYPIIDPANHMLGIKEGGNVFNANNNSYVKGPFRHFGKRTLHDFFDFPVGLESGANKYRPIRINNIVLPAGMSYNDPRAYTALTARYYFDNPNSLSTNLESPILRVSDCEYWSLDEYYSPWHGITPYPFACNVALSWYSNLNDNCNSDFYQFANHVASLRDTGTPSDEWIDEGNSAVTAAIPINYDMIMSDGNVATLGPNEPNYFTLATDIRTCNLVTNGNFSAGNTGFYSSLANNCSCAHSSYCVGNKPSAKCSSATWGNDIFDHTIGNALGSYLIVDGENAVSLSSTIWGQSNVPVIAGETYTFSFWAVRAITGWVGALNYQDLSFLIDGTTIASVTTASTNYDDWVKYSTNWVAPSTGLIDIEISQTGSGFIGIPFPFPGANDFGIDDIEFTACCAVEAEFTYAVDQCTVNFTDISAGSGTIVSWDWDFGDLASGTSNSSVVQNPQHIYSGPGLYTACLTVCNVVNGDTCYSTFCDDVHVLCPSFEPCNVNANFNHIGAFGSLTRNFTDNSTATGTIIDWYWDFGDPLSGAANNTSTLQNPSHTFSASGLYNVCLTTNAISSSGACIDQKCKTVNAKKKKIKISKFAVHPNPFKNSTNVKIFTEDPVNASLIVKNLMGQTVTTIFVGTLQPGNNHFTWTPINSQPNGVYSIILQTDTQMLVEMVIKK